MNKFIACLFVGFFLLTSCSDDKTIPKPPTYLRLDLPDHEYLHFSDNCPYSFDVSNIFKVRGVRSEDGATCHKDIDLGPLNGTIHFSYIEMNESLSEYVNFAINKVDEHKVKALAIEDTNFIRPSSKVYGTFFELQGDVASPFQFYLTDSTKRFVSGVVYLNATPRYDSLKPSLDYLKKDLYRMIETFEWK
jgi:gliding motility-associated lipoprotein GldD